MEAVTAVAPGIGVSATCHAVGVPRASYYRSRRPAVAQRPRPSPPRTLSGPDREEVLAVLHEPRFADWVPAQVHAQLLDEGEYLCSVRTMQRLIAETCHREGIAAGELTLCADRGSSMTSKAVALLLSDLGVTRTHSRPHVSNDNPFSESQFKTLKYRPGFPDRFGSLEHARDFSRDLFHWYNIEHHHGGLGFLTPADVHHGRAVERLAARAAVLAAAHAHHPERFVRGFPKPPPLPSAVWINPPPAIDLRDCSRRHDLDPDRNLMTTPGVASPVARPGASDSEVSLML